MKRFFFKSVSIILAISMLSLHSLNIYASNYRTIVTGFNHSVFSFDDKLLNDALQELNQLNAYLEEHEDVTFTELSEAKSPLVANIANDIAPMGMDGQDGEPPLGIPSFLWGCVFGWVGLLIVYIMTDQDKEQAKKALWGCVTGTTVWIVVYVVLVAIAVESEYYYY